MSKTEKRILNKEIEKNSCIFVTYKLNNNNNVMKQNIYNVKTRCDRKWSHG